MTEICFAGVTGWTAPPIVAAIDKAEDLSLTAGVSRSAAGKRLAEVAGSTSTAWSTVRWPRPFRTPG